MADYFYDSIPAEEREKLNYIPTLSEFVEWIRKNFGKNPALSDIEKTYNYEEMCHRIALRRDYINSLKLKQGSHIAIMERNSINAIEMFLAVTTSGNVAIMLPNALPEAAIIGCTQKFDIDYLFYGRVFEKVCANVPCPKASVEIMGQNEAPVVSVDKEEPAAIFFTGGTTGAPKGVVLPHRALMRGAYNGCFMPGKVLGCQRYIAFLPLSHVFGMIRGTLSALHTGSLIYSCEDMKAGIQNLPKMRPTCLVLVPGICEILLGLVRMYGEKFLGGELRTIIAGAANVPPRQIAEFEKLGVKLLGGYGMTEGANLTTGNIDVDTHPTSVGKIYTGQEAKIVDGELWFRGDNLMLGYYKDEAATKAALTEDGWLKTGDLARIDEDGFVYIVGRIKNLIILANGENVSPENIEELFYKDARVKDCLVFEDKVNDIPCIAIDILPQPDFMSSQNWEEVEKAMHQLVADINKTLPSTHQIAQIHVRKDDFKRTGSMKVSRNQN